MMGDNDPKGIWRKRTIVSMELLFPMADKRNKINNIVINSAIDEISLRKKHFMAANWVIHG